MELINVNNTKYDEYVHLVEKRDSLKKDANLIRVAYLKAFGSYVKESYEIKMDCIRLKKMISYCQTKVNHNEKIIGSSLDTYIDIVMASYENELEDLKNSIEQARKSRRISENDVKLVRTVYRRIAKRIHPDMNPQFADSAELHMLWIRTVNAYSSNDLEELQNLEVLVGKSLESCGTSDIKIDIPDISSRIEKLETQIHSILTTDPYTYKPILEDPERYNEEKKKLEDEIQEFSVYRSHLKTILKSYKIERILN